MSQTKDDLKKELEQLRAQNQQLEQQKLLTEFRSLQSQLQQVAGQIQEKYPDLWAQLTNPQNGQAAKGTLTKESSNE